MLHMFKQVEESKCDKEREEKYKIDPEGYFNLELKYSYLVGLRVD